METFFFHGQMLLASEVLKLVKFVIPVIVKCQLNWDFSVMVRTNIKVRLLIGDSCLVNRVQVYNLVLAKQILTNNLSSH